MDAETPTQSAPDSPAESLRLAPVSAAEKPVLFAIMQLYLYDSSDYTGDEVGATGVYAYHYFDLYWTEDGRFPFLIMLDNQIVGLALVRQLERGPDPLHQLAEFFIMRSYRRRGLGRAAATAVFDRFPGRWEVQQSAANHAGRAFWQRVIDDYTQSDYENHWRRPPGPTDIAAPPDPVQVFRTPPAAPGPAR